MKRKKQKPKFEFRILLISDNLFSGRRIGAAANIWQSTTKTRNEAPLKCHEI